MVTIIDDTIINDLTEETNWRLGSIFIDIGHVQVIHEVDKHFVRWGTESLTGSLVDI